MDSEAKGEKSSQSCFLYYDNVEKTMSNMFYFSGSMPPPYIPYRFLFELLLYSI